MAKFRKQIVKAGVYEIPVPGSSKTRSEALPPERLKRWADVANEMLKDGHRIPAPWKHDERALPVQVGPDGTLSTSYDNGGFWDKFWTQHKDGVLSLWGEVDVPGNPEDPNTPAGRVGKTVKDVSIYVRPEFGDGSGKGWQDAIMHVGLVTHPIEKGQPNFESSEGLALSMSQLAYEMNSDMPPGYSGNASFSPELIRKLREIAKISLPDDTTDVNFCDRLNAALEQKKISEEDEEGSIRTKPKGAKEPPAPIIAMALTPQQIESLVQSKAVNPATGKPFTKEELTESTKMSQPADIKDSPVVQGLVKANQILMSHLSNSAKDSRQQRVNSLKTRGLSQAVIDAQIKPLLDSFQMSFGDDGKPVPHPVDYVLAALEASLPQGTAMSQPGGLTLSQLTDPSIRHMLPQDMNGLAALLGHTGIAMSQPAGSEAQENPLASGQDPGQTAGISEEESDRIAMSFLRNTQMLPPQSAE